MPAYPLAGRSANGEYVSRSPVRVRVRVRGEGRGRLRGRGRGYLLGKG